MNPEDVLADPAASFWLKQAIRDCLARDPLDAANDASKLDELMQGRAKHLVAMQATRHNVTT